jgi:hypothetical protein
LKEHYVPYECSICGQKPIWNSKPLSLTLDYIKGNNKDNRLENIRWACPNCDRQLETFGSKNRIVKRKHFYCKDCGCEINKESIRCTLCENIHIRKTNIEKLPLTRDELKILIKTTSFVKIGRMFNVSDNAIRKWCKKLDLPFKTSDIKKYSEDEWILL